MNFLKKITFLLLFPLMVSLISCQQEPKQEVDQAIEAIPANSTIVTAFDIPTLMKKANFAAIQKMDFYQFFMEKAKEESDILAAVFANPENAGIDLTKKAYLSIELNPDNPEEIYTGLIFNLASTEDFKGFAAAFRNSSINSQNGYQLANLNESTLLAWNDKIGVIALGEGIAGTTTVDAFFAPATETSPSKNQNLLQLLSQKHDVTTWLTSNALAKNSSAKLVLSMAKIKPEALNDNFIHGHLDFKEGQVIAKADYFFQEELIQDINLLFKDQVKTDFSAYIPGQNLNAYVSAALSFEGLDKALSKRMQVKTFVDFFLRGYGISIEKLRTIFDGDLVLATYTGNLNNRQEGLFATKINDSPQLEELLMVAEEKEFLTKTGNGRYLISPSLNKLLKSTIGIDIGGQDDNQLMFKEGIAFISGNINLLDQIENGPLTPTQQVPENVKTLVTQNPFALFMDFNSLKRTGIPGANSLGELKLSSTSKGADFQLEMKEKERNSLHTIFKAINEEFLKNREQKQPVSEGKS